MPSACLRLAARPLVTPPAHAHARFLFSLNGTVITQYVDLPPGYEDADGLPFRRRGDLEAREVSEVFGPSMNPAAANRLLRILHGRRVAGTLDDPEFRPNTARYRQAETAAALAYLRKTTPVDELMNAGLRAEDELAALEALGGEEADDTATAAGATDEAGSSPAGRDAGTAAPKPGSARGKWAARLFRDAPSGDVYGVGAFDAIRARNRAKHEVREREREVAEAARREAQEKEWAERGAKVRDLVGPDGRAAPTGLVREMSPRIRQYALAATSALEAPPSMPAWQRLWPSYATVLALVVGGSVLASSVGSSGGSGADTTGATGTVFPGRLFPALSPAAATMLALVAANVAVFAMWHIPPLWRLLNRYMIVVPATPRPLSLLGAMFSHQKAGHLLINAVFLWFLGVRLHEEIGRPAFLQVYFTSGLLAFLVSETNIVLRNNLHLTTLGASGAIYGIATAYFMLHKFDGFKILGLPPDPYNGIQGLGFIGLLLGLNLLTLRAEKQAIDVATHFGGMAVGAAFGEYLRIQKEEAAAAVADGRPPRSVWKVLVAGRSSTKPALEEPPEGGQAT